MPQTEKQKIGELGENIAVKHLVKHQFKILGRNYRKKWGEIDIIAEKDEIIHFIEVKTVTHETNSDYQPEENVHPWKRKRLSRIIQTYLSDISDKVSDDIGFQIDIIAVFLNLKTKQAKIRITENIILL